MKSKFERLFCYFLLSLSQILVTFANLYFFGDLFAHLLSFKTCWLRNVNSNLSELILRHEFFGSWALNRAFLRIVSAESTFRYWLNLILHLTWIREFGWCSATTFRPNCSALNFSSLLIRSIWLTKIQYFALESIIKVANSRDSISF